MMEYIVPIIVFAVIGAVSGVLLTVASKAFAVKTDERLEKLSEALPQINCGACGFSGCNDYAQAVLNGEKCNLCKPGGADTAKALSEIMGVESGEVEEAVAFVRCAGNCDKAVFKYDFSKLSSCRGANRFYNGSKSCVNGCLGLGDCVKVCPEDAICIDKGIAVVNTEKCIGCGLCKGECPNGIIELMPKTAKVAVRCSSTAPAKVVRTVCKAGCVGCRMCEKACPRGAIKVMDNFASIDYSSCISCGKCVEVCKFGAVQFVVK